MTPAVARTDQFDEFGKIFANEHYPSGVRSYENEYEDGWHVHVVASGAILGDPVLRLRRSEPRVLRLGEELALVAWTSTVTDGDSGSVRGRLVHWPAP